MISAAANPPGLAVRAIGAAALLVLCGAGSVFARADAGWTAQRAELYSQVCVEATSGCVCDLSLGVPNQTEVAEAMFKRLLRDFPDSWRPSPAHEDTFGSIFERNGVKARLVLVPSSLDVQTWTSAQVIETERCPI